MRIFALRLSSTLGNSFSMSYIHLAFFVMMPSFPYFAPKLFCLPCIWLVLLQLFIIIIIIDIIIIIIILLLLIIIIIIIIYLFIYLFRHLCVLLSSYINLYKNRIGRIFVQSIYTINTIYCLCTNQILLSKPYRSSQQFSLKFFFLTIFLNCPVGSGCKIYRLLLYRGVRPPLTSVLDMTLNNQMVRFQLYRNFGEGRAALHCYYSQVHSDPEWLHLIRFYLWVK